MEAFQDWGNGGNRYIRSNVCHGMLNASTAMGFDLAAKKHSGALDDFVLM